MGNPTIRHILNDAANRVGWNEESMVTVLLDFVDEQNLHIAFGAYVGKRTREEDEMSRKYGDG